MTRLFTALLATETETFGPYPTGWATWKDMLDDYADTSIWPFSETRIGGEGA